MLNSLFNPEALFWRMMSTLVDVLALSVLWLFCSLPIITLGAATAALYDAAVKCVRTGQHGALRRYVSTFKRELVPSIPPTVIFAAALAVLLFLLPRLLWQGLADGMEGFNVALAAYLVVLLLPVGAVCWAFPILSRFTQSPLGLVKASAQFAVAFLPRTVLIALLTAAAVLVSWLYWFPMVFLPCAVALLWSLLMEKPFRKFMPDSPAPGPGEDI